METTHLLWWMETTHLLYATRSPHQPTASATPLKNPLAVRHPPPRNPTAPCLLAPRQQAVNDLVGAKLQQAIQVAVVHELQHALQRAGRAGSGRRSPEQVAPRPQRVRLLMLLRLLLLLRPGAAAAAAGCRLLTGAHKQARPARWRPVGLLAHAG
jgi:hypothetical protein